MTMPLNLIAHKTPRLGPRSGIRDTTRGAKDCSV